MSKKDHSIIVHSKKSAFQIPASYVLETPRYYFILFKEFMKNFTEDLTVKSLGSRVMTTIFTVFR